MEIEYLSKRIKDGSVKRPKKMFLKVIHLDLSKLDS